MIRMGSCRLLLRRALGQAGYTLVETLVVMTLLVIVIGAIADGFTSASKTETDQVARADDQEAARQALERLRKDIHCASAASVGANTQGGYTLNLTVGPDQCVGVTAGNGLGNELSDGVQWCTVPVNGATNRYGLYRTIVTQCDAADAIFQVDYVTQADLWGPIKCGDGDSHLELVSVDLPVNRDIATRPDRTYRLQDQIALRNDTAFSGAQACG
jgi:prepilin-type N-terminal cleavage/methylation domain-containing protein